jgi:hypothetical protein
MFVPLLILWTFSPTKTTYWIEDFILEAGRAFVFFKRTKDSWTAVRLSWYSLPDDEAGIFDYLLISTVG